MIERKAEEEPGEECGSHLKNSIYNHFDDVINLAKAFAKLLGCQQQITTSGPVRVFLTLSLLILCFANGCLADQTITSTPSSSSSSSSSSNSSNGDFICPEKFGYYEDKKDCSKYFVCVFGEALHEICTGGLYFSVELQTCDWPRNVQCGKEKPDSNSSHYSNVDEGEHDDEPVYEDLDGGKGLHRPSSDHDETQGLPKIDEERKIRKESEEIDIQRSRVQLNNNNNRDTLQNPNPNSNNQNLSIPNYLEDPRNSEILGRSISGVKPQNEIYTHLNASQNGPGIGSSGGGGQDDSDGGEHSGIEEKATLEENSDSRGSSKPTFIDTNSYNNRDTLERRTRFDAEESILQDQSSSPAGTDKRNGLSHFQQQHFQQQQHFKQQQQRQPQPSTAGGVVTDKIDRRGLNMYTFSGYPNYGDPDILILPVETTKPQSRPRNQQRPRSRPYVGVEYMDELFEEERIPETRLVNNRDNRYQPVSEYTRNTPIPKFVTPAVHREFKPQYRPSPPVAPVPVRIQPNTRPAVAPRRVPQNVAPVSRFPDQQDQGRRPFVPPYSGYEHGQPPASLPQQPRRPPKRPAPAPRDIPPPTLVRPEEHSRLEPPAVVHEHRQPQVYNPKPKPQLPRNYEYHTTHPPTPPRNQQHQPEVVTERTKPGGAAIAYRDYESYPDTERTLPPKKKEDWTSYEDTSKPEQPRVVNTRPDPKELITNKKNNAGIPSEHGEPFGLADFEEDDVLRYDRRTPTPRPSTRDRSFSSHSTPRETTTTRRPYPEEFVTNTRQTRPARKPVPKTQATTRNPTRTPFRPPNVYQTPVPFSTATKCNRTVCRLPDCNCGSSEIPNRLPVNQVPQILMITFDDAINDLNWDIYEEVFGSNRKNPNGCPLVGTFYVSHEWTDYGHVQSMYAKGHEMASHGVTHSFGEKFSVNQWQKEVNGQREILHLYGGVNLEDVRGMRAPFLQIGGNKMFEMLYRANFTYDSSMPVFDNKPPFWPYTLDYAINHECMIAPCPTKSFPGVWEVGMVMWEDLRGGRCSMGDACSNPSDEDGVYEMLMKNFNRHYKSNRAPLGLYYHSAWFNTAHHRRGFARFLDEILKNKDVFFTTKWQMIQWVRNPTPLSRINSFEPWDCDKVVEGRPAPCTRPSVCNVRSDSGSRYMKTCQPCPKSYPWVGKTGFDSS